MDWRTNFICCPHVKKTKGIQKVYAYKLRACCRKCRRNGYLSKDIALNIYEVDGRFIGEFLK